MHENREISNTPWSSDQGRSAKATNRTADMHVQEKSDCAVVPVNQPNKEGQPSAEVGEGRAETKENIVQSHMHPTQSGKRMDALLPVSSPQSRHLPRRAFQVSRSRGGRYASRQSGIFLCVEPSLLEHNGAIVTCCFSQRHRSQAVVKRVKQQKYD